MPRAANNHRDMLTVLLNLLHEKGFPVTKDEKRIINAEVYEKYGRIYNQYQAVCDFYKQITGANPPLWIREDANLKRIFVEVLRDYWNKFVPRTEEEICKVTPKEHLSMQNSIRLFEESGPAANNLALKINPESLEHSSKDEPDSNENIDFERTNERYSYEGSIWDEFIQETDGQELEYKFT